MNRTVQRALLPLILVILTVSPAGSAEPQSPAEPKTLADLNQPPLPAEQDAATYLRQVQDDVKALSRAWAIIENQPKESIQTGAYDEADRKALRAALDQFPKIIPTLEKAAACPGYRAPLNFAAGPDKLLGDLNPVIQEQRNLAHLLSVHARLLALEGKPDEAMTSCLLSLRLNHHFESNPLLIGYLVTVAIRAVAIGESNFVLRSGPIARDLRKQLDAELRRMESSKAFDYVLKSERLYNLAAHRRFGGNQEEEEKAIAALPRFAAELRVKPYAEFTAAFAKIKTEMSPKAPAAKLLLPAYEKVCEADFRNRALIRCLRVLIALQDPGPHFNENDPKATNLGLPPAATTDPYTGKTLLMKKAGGHWIIYSVGTNLVDDGGDVEMLKDVGLGVPKQLQRKAAGQ